MALNIVSLSKVWHMMIGSDPLEKLVKMMVDQSTFQNGNLGIFKDPNPELRPTESKSHKSPILKLQVVFNLGRLPESCTGPVISSKLHSFYTYRKDFSPESNPQKTENLHDLLVNLSKKETLKGENAYYCSTCKSH